MLPDTPATGLAADRARIGLKHLALALALMGGCATVDPARTAVDDPARLRQETEKLRAEVAELRGQLEATRRAAAQRVDLGVREVRAELEAVQRTLEAAVRDADQRQAEVDARERRVAAVEKRMAELAATLSRLEASVNGLADQVARLGTLPSPRKLFDRAMESFRKGEHAQAVLDWADLAKAYPWDPLAAPAQFWIGEAYFKVREYERAIVEYRKAVDLAPRGKETPDALLRIGLAQRALKRESRAREAWTQLMRDFPGTDAAQQARRALREK